MKEFFGGTRTPVDELAGHPHPDSIQILSPARGGSGSVSRFGTQLWGIIVPCFPEKKTDTTPIYHPICAGLSSATLFPTAAIRIIPTRDASCERNRNLRSDFNLRLLLIESGLVAPDHNAVAPLANGMGLGRCDKSSTGNIQAEMPVLL